MINFDEYTNENKRKHNPNYPYIPDHPYRILEPLEPRDRIYVKGYGFMSLIQLKNLLQMQ